jgi:hypothetical protein
MKKTTVIRTLLSLCLLATTAALQAQSNNTTLGQYALNPSTTGSYNNAIGYYTLYANTSGNYNNAIGIYALRNNTGGSNNTALGYYALYANTTGGYNSALGVYALYGNTTGTYNIGFGYNAGRYIANGSTANATATNSIYLGRDTKSLAAGQSNEIVLGYNATGAGSNTVTLGSSAITKTVLNGNVGIGTTDPTSKVHINYPAVSTPVNAFTIDVASFSTWDNAEQSSFFKVRDIGRDDPAFIIQGDGNVGINTSTPDAKLGVNGSIRATENITADRIVSRRNNPEIGGALVIENPAKTGAGQASSWYIYNMSGSYGNSLQFHAYDNIGCVSGGLCAPRLVLMDNGNVGIGTYNPYYKLDVSGTIRAHEVKVNLNTGADFVFEKDYNLMSLNELSDFIQENKHLPEIAPATEMTATDTNLGELVIKLLQKVEEQTLYIIRQDEKLQKFEMELKELKNK